MLTRIEPIKSSGTDWVSKSAIKSTTYSTDGLRVGCGGIEAAVLITPTGSATASLLQQYSTDNVNFYDPYDINASNISTLFNASLTKSVYITFTPKAGEYMRFNFSHDGTNMSVTATFIQQEEIY